MRVIFRATIPGTVRSKKNSRTATTVGGKNKPVRAILVPSQAYQKWEKAARQYVQKAIQGTALPLAPSGGIAVQAVCYYKGKRPDLSGALESVGDMIEGLVIADDSQIISWDGSRVRHEKRRPRIEITVWEVDHGAGTEAN